MSYRNSYQHKALISVIDNVYQGLITNVLAWAAVIWATRVWQREETATMIFTAAAVLVSIVHFSAAGPLFKKAGKIKRARLFLAASFMGAATWGIFAAYILSKFELSWTSFFLILVLVAIAIAKVVPFSSQFLFLFAFEALLLGPAILVNFFYVGGLQGLGIGVFLTLYIGVILILGRLNNKSHWKLFHSHARTEAMLDALPCTLAWVDSDSTYLGVNKKQAEFWDKDPSEFKGQKLGFTQGSSYLPQFVKQLFGTSQDNLSTYVERNSREYLVTGKTFNNKSEAVVVGLDVTDQKELESELNFKKQLGEHTAHLTNLGEIVASISKELRDCVDKKNTDRLARLVESLSYLTERDAEKATKFKLEELAKDIGELFLHRLAAGGISYHVLADSDAHIDCPAPAVAQVLVNLVSNAIDVLEKHNGEEKQITIHITKNCIFVHDSGPGVPEDIRDQIFEPMFTTKNADEASGVGLSTSKLLIEGIGGELRYNSKDGSTFEVCFN